MHVGVVAAVPSQVAGLPRPRLVQAAHEFEAQMMKELLKPMTGSSTLDEDNPGSGGTMTDFASEVLGQCLSRSGGFGIATTILQGLSKNETPPQPAPDSAGGGDEVPGEMQRH
jgi:Rod binding domain-containing protein